MKVVVLAAFIVAVSSGRLSSESNPGEDTQWPWQVGKLYRYDVETHTLARLQEGASTGSAFKARFIVRVKSPGQLQAKLENPQHAQVHHELGPKGELPDDLKYQPVQNLEKPFEISVAGGRVLSLILPSTVPLAQENLLKGLIGALQVDLSTYRNIHTSHDTYDKEIQQGLFRKMETDVTGDCQTLYSVSPVASEWRRELPNFASDEEPIEITKTKNYGHCHHRVEYHFGVHAGAEWSGTAHKPRQEQFIKRSTVARILAGKQGPIYKSETTNTVHAHPHLYGEQQAEVHSQVKLTLVSYEPDSEPEWEKPEGARPSQNLLYSMSSKQVTIEDSSSSSSSSSSSESHEKQYSHQVESEESPKERLRRSAKPNKIVAINKVIINKRGIDHSGSSSSSSSSDSSSAYVNDDIPRNNEPAYAALYMNPQPHADKKQNPMNAQKLVQEIAQQLQNPNNMPKVDFLSKFNILVRIIASMSSGQLSQTSRSIEIAKSSNNIIKSDMWMIYRDAVAQAGTLPAFQQIKTWIQGKKIQGEEAAKVISTLPNTLRYPTKELMTQFFELAMSPEVREQEYLNSTALISACKFINMGQVNNDTAHVFYPTHMYGRLSRQNDAFVIEEILPRLQQELTNAMQQDDGHKQQVYIRAIGNLGHRAILDVYAPYLEGKIPASTYIRTQMVENLKVLAHQKDSHARAVLYSILKNTAEPYEVRVAAVKNIFMTHPNGPMMLAMAEMTHDDPSVQVRAVIKSSIESAAELKNPRYFELARTAQAARDLLTTETFGKQYSTNVFTENYDTERNILSIMTHIGSEDSLFPKYLKYFLRNKAEGWGKDSAVSISFSNVKEIVDYLKEQLYGDRKINSDAVPNHKYSAEKVAQMLNIKPDHHEPLRAAFEIVYMNQQRLFAFGESDLKQLAESIKEYGTELKNGVENHFTKVFNQAQVSVMFPVATGMPFILKYKEPSVIHIQGKAKAEYNYQSENDYSGSMDKEMHLTFARNIDGSIGFLDTLTNQHASAGVVNKFHVHIPVKMHIQVTPKEVKMNVAPINPEQDTTLVHFSNWPYTANQKKDSLTPISQDPTTKLVTRRNKEVSVDYKFGQQIGSAYQLQGYSYSKNFKNLGQILTWNGPLNSIIEAIRPSDVAQSHFNLRYLGKQTKNKVVSVIVAHDTYHNQEQVGQFNPVASEVTDVSPNSEERRKELVKRAVTGIKTAKADVVDVSLTFDGPQKVEYVATAAIGESPVDDKIQYVIFAGRNSVQDGVSQINAAGTQTKPKVAHLNYLDALKNDLKIPFEIDIHLGQKTNIHFSGQAERSDKFVEELKSHPIAKQCEQEIANGNQYQEACHKMIVISQAPDTFKVSLTYEEVSHPIKNVAYQVYKFLENYDYWRTDVAVNFDLAKPKPDGKLDIAVYASYLADTMDLVFTSKYGQIHVNDLPIPKVAASTLSAYRPFKTHELVYNYYTSDLYQPFCSVDGTRVRSFSRRSYPYTLTNSWHVVVHRSSEHPGDSQEQYVVLARKPNEHQQEMYISYQSENGKHLEIEIHPAQGGSGQPQIKVNTNAKKVSEGDLTTYWDDVEDEPLLEYHYGEDGVLSLEIREDRLRVMYDGERLVVLDGESRNVARGICGQMSGDRRDDYLTPNGLVDKPEYYGASFALDHESSDPKTKQLKEQAKQKAYQSENHFTTILRSDEEWKKVMHSSSEENWGSQIVYRSRSYLKTKGPCKLQQQVQFYENHGEICITTSPLKACQSHCSSEGYKVQSAQVVCRPKLDQQFRAYRDQIRQGQNPQVNGVPKNRQFRVPSSCVA